MAKKISQLALLETLTGLESFPVSYGGENYKVTLSSLNFLFTKKSLGLNLVDNTSDAEKPVSRPTQLALDEKASIVSLNALAEVVSGKANGDHRHSKDSIEGLTEDLTKINQDIGLIGDATTALGRNVSTLQEAVNNFRLPTEHPISFITGLSEALSTLNTRMLNKAEALHQHTASQILDFSSKVNEIINEKSFISVKTSEW